MPIDNSEQIAEWNGALGQRWVAMQREIDRIVMPFGYAALEIAAPLIGYLTENCCRAGNLESA